jgi:phosphopentomutase
VFQIAAHETHFGLERLYDICAIAKRLLEPLQIARVIARPFIGERAGSFQRTSHRRDITTPPPEETLLDRVMAGGR